jgi:hypothetical protein
MAAYWAIPRVALKVARSAGWRAGQWGRVMADPWAAWLADRKADLSAVGMVALSVVLSADEWAVLTAVSTADS